MDTLEVIAPSGEIKFVDLDPNKGIINIGKHRDNDVVVNGPNVAPFHAILDHRQQPYQLVVLSHQGQTRMGGQSLSVNTSTPFNTWDVLELDGFSLILVDSHTTRGANGGAPNGGALPAGATTPRPPSQPPQAPRRSPSPPPQAPPLRAGPRPAVMPLPSGQAAPTTAPERPPAAEVPTAEEQAQGLVPANANKLMPVSTPVPTISDDVILTEVTDTEWELNVEETANTTITIINGGPIVAAFQVHVDGIDPNWVTITPPSVNLNEGSRTTITVSITPPRSPASRAGVHNFGLLVTSPNHPGRVSQIGAVLTLKPFYGFTVSDLSPKRQNVSWFKRSGEAGLSLSNQGNSNTLFSLDGIDDEQACNFEFQLPNEAVRLAKQAELTLAPQESAAINVIITPRQRRLIGLRKKSHPFTITARLPEADTFPRSILGQVDAKPLIGFFTIVLLLLLAVIGFYLLFQPRITQFQPDRLGVRAGQEVLLEWQTFPGPLVSVALTGNDEAMETSRGSASDRPMDDTTYQLTANTFLSRYLPGLPYPQSERAVEVLVTPVQPTIRLFEVSKNRVTEGETVVLSWLVSEAAQQNGLTLFQETAQGETELGQLEDNTGSLVVQPEQDTIYRLEGIHPSQPEDPERQWVSVAVVPPPTPVVPTATPIPPPVIDYFIVQPQVITPEGQVNLSWGVRGVEEVSVQAVSAEPLPPVMEGVVHSPGQTTLYVLMASNEADTVRAIQQVTVETVATPTPTPTVAPVEPPVIEVFTITPEDGIAGEDVEVRLDWYVSGDYTNIVLSGGPEGMQPFANLLPFDNATFDVTETTVFILTAFNGEAKSTSTVQVRFVEPTATPEPEETDPGTEDPGTEDPEDALQIVRFEALPLDSSRDMVTQVSSDPLIYEVEAGSNVDLQWQVDNANTVSIIGLGEQPATGNYTLFDVRAGSTYQLDAVGDSGSESATLQLRVVAQTPPPAPTDLNGTVSGNDITLTWNYDSQFINDIIGFRIYRATVPPGGFVRVADESTLTNLATQWTDSGVSPTCGKEYIIVAVYEDAVSGDKKETNASRYSWFSGVCP